MSSGELVEEGFFDYELPEERIAQRPLGRSKSKLLVAHARTSSAVEITDSSFSELSNFLRAGDLLVLNNSKVLPARFFVTVGDANRPAEVLLLRRLSVGVSEQWEALARPMRIFGIGADIQLSAHLRAWVRGRTEDEQRLVLDLRVVESDKSIRQLIEDEGSMPIPPYIRDGKAEESDKQNYQTVYAGMIGSVAAPTAGLHFSEELLSELETKGIQHTFITHHVGPASFLPVRDENWKAHVMLSEEYSIGEESAKKIAAAKNNRQRIIAVGTTTVRALESAAVAGMLGKTTNFSPTELFITPGYQFKFVDVLLTNFHQPRTTHLLLVSAFIGGKNTADIYAHALSGQYRFLSYGDAMLLFPDSVETPSSCKLLEAQNSNNQEQELELETLELE